MDACLDRPPSAVCRLDAINDGVDLPSIVRLFTDSAVRRFLGGPVAAEVGSQRARDVVCLARHAWAIRPCTANIEAPLLGIVVLDPHHDSDQLEISFLLLPEHWGRGYGKSGVMQVLTYAFETRGLPQVLAETQSCNAASARLLERLGFKFLCCVTRFGAEQRVYGVDARSFMAAERIGRRQPKFNIDVPPA